MKMPRSTHTIITLVIAGILSVLFMIGYLNLINPNDRQALKYDQQRESDFAKLKTAIQDYYTKKDQLPDTLETLKEEIDRDADSRTSTSMKALDNLLTYRALPQRDPYSNRPYEYKVEGVSATKYQLCTGFFKENKGDDSAVDKGSSREVKHGSGNQCIDFEVKNKEIRSFPKPNYYQRQEKEDWQTQEDPYSGSRSNSNY